MISLYFENIKSALTNLVAELEQNKHLLIDGSITLHKAIEDANYALEGVSYFYTYKLPYTSKSRFIYWRVKNKDEVWRLAFKRHKTAGFYIGNTTAEGYRTARFRGN